MQDGYIELAGKVKNLELILGYPREEIAALQGNEPVCIVLGESLIFFVQGFSRILHLLLFQTI